MSDVVMQIDGKEVKASGDMTVLQAARQAGIHIPTLCHHDKLEAFGGCRMCMVEVETRGRKSYVVSCLYPVAKDLVVRTRSERVDKIRRTMLEELLAHAPNSPELVALAKEYRADPNRFDEDKHLNAVDFIERGASREISFIPEIAAKECWDCQECFALCPTSYAQAAYFLTEALAFPGRRKQTAPSA